MRKTKPMGFVFIAVLLAANALALGVSPARTELNYYPGTTKDIIINVLNNEHKDMNLLVYVDDEFLDAVEIPEKLVEVKSNEPSKQVSFRVKMNKAEKYGMNEIKLKVLELPESSGDEDATKIGATVEVVHQIRIHVPYPGVYAEIPDVYITSAEDMSNVMFTLPVYNRGEQDLYDIKAIIIVYDMTGAVAGSVETNTLSLKSGSKGKVVAKFLNPKRGKYRAEINVSYAGKEQTIERDFFVGKELVEIRGVTVDKFSLGSIAKFNIILENTWNELIDDIYAEVEIRDSENRHVTKFKTASTDAEPGSVEVVNAFWDTEEANPGTYSLHILLHYAQLITDRWFTMDVGFDSIKIREGVPGAVTASQPAESPYLPALLVLVIIANLVVLLLIYRYRKKSR